MNQLKQYVIGLLCIGMFLSCATAKVAATDLVSVPSEESVKEKAIIIGEDSAKRDEYSKTFVLSDHTYMVAVYDEPVHVKNSNGNWEDIDNSMSIMNGNDSVDTQILQNTHGKYTIKLAKNSLNKNLVTYALGDYTLKWDFVDANKVFAEVITPTYEEPNNNNNNDDKFLKLKNQQSQVIYREIYANVDVRYTINSAKLKEDIILKNSLAQNVFYSEYDIGSLVAVQRNDQTIELIDPGKPEFAQIVLSAPVMSDAIGNISLDVKIEIVSQNNNKLIIKTTGDQTWLTDLSTIYPVTIDPVIETSQNISLIEDTFVSLWKPNTAYYYMGSTWIGKEGATYGTCRILVKFPTLPTLASGDKVISAKLNMVQEVNAFNTSGPTTLQLNVHEITQSWNLTTTTWNTNVSYNSSVVSDYFVTSAAFNAKKNTWDITQTVQKWYDGTLTNNGVMIKATDEFEAGSAIVRNFYLGTGSGVDGMYPSLQINYLNTNGLEDLWTNTTLDIGRAGTAYVNNYTGNLTLMRNDISIAGGKIPVSISSFYNYDSRASGTRFSWRTNYNQTIASMTIGTSTYYKYIDGDGTSVYFKYESSKWIDELGKGLILTIDPASTTARYVIKDKYNNILEFDSSGYLKKLKDANQIQNSITITIVSGLIDYLTDSSGRKYEFTYTSGRLIKIEYMGTGSAALRTISYAYNDTARTMTVTFPDSMSVIYYYDSDFKIIKAVDIDNSTVEFAYSGTPKLVQAMTEHATDGTTHGNQYGFTYSPLETTVVDKYNESTYYQFDTMGRTICIKDANNSAQFFEYGATGGSENKIIGVSKEQSATQNLAKNISFETTSDWLQYDSMGTLVTPNYSTSSPLLGAKSLKIENPGETGRIIYAYENIPVTVTETTSYTLSAYVKSSVAGAAHVSISTNGNPIETSLDINVDSVNVWQRVRATITVDDVNVTSLKIMLVVDNTATVYFDGIQLEEGLGASSFNLIENPSLEYVTGTVPTSWSTSGTSSSTDYSVTSQSLTGVKSYKINGGLSSTKKLTQTIPISGNAGETFSFGGWAKANAVPYFTDRNFRMTLAFDYTNVADDVYIVNFNNSSNSWQYITGSAVSIDSYSSLTISYEYTGQLNAVYFDATQLVRESYKSTYTYDSLGNLSMMTDIKGKSSVLTYDNQNQLTNLNSTDGTSTTFAYNSLMQPFSVTGSTGISTYTNYDVYGNPVSTKISVSGLGNKLIAYYKFENDMDDSSGNGYNGTNYSGTYVSGKVDNAIRFNGTTQYGELGNFKVPEIFTMTMWVKNERIATNECIIGKNTSTGGNQLLFGGYNSKVTVDVSSVNGVDFGLKTLGYQFLVAIFEKVDSTTTHITVYKDMVKIYDADYTGQVGDTSTGKVWALGMEWDSSTKSDFFQGSIDELAFFNGALDITEIQSLYDQANKEQLVAMYDFNSASGGVINDNSVNGHNATYTGGVTFVSGAMVLNGSTGYMQLDDFTIGQDLTIAMTIKPDVIKNFSLFAKHDAAGNNILIDGYYAGVHTRIRDGIVTGGALTAGVSKTIVYTIKKVNMYDSRIQIYINGVAQLADNTQITSVLGDTIGKPWVIGQEWDGSTGSDFFDGTIDNLAIYNYELSSSDVSTNATALANGTFVPSSTISPISVNSYKSINSSTTYTADGNYITSETDESGNISYYNYYSTYGRLNSFRATGESIAEATNYTYDANTDQVISITKTVDGMTYSNSYTYDLDKLTKITHNGFDYEFTYDSFGNQYQVKVAGTVLVTNQYQSNNGLLEYTNYGNGAVVKYEYDEAHRVVARKVNNVLKFEYCYDQQGNLLSVTDHTNSAPVSYTYYYDFMNKATKVVGSNGHDMVFAYDDNDRIKAVTNIFDDGSITNEYVYGDSTIGENASSVYSVKLNGSTKLSYSFDQLERLSTRTISTSIPFTTTYTYLDGTGANSTTTLLASLTNGTNVAFNYTYDVNGNILTIREGTTLKATFTYDKMNQLNREDNVYSSKSIDYVYDIGGNIVSRSEYNYTGGVRGSLIHTYNYNYSASWKDQMTSYDGQSITYDTIGNPLTYRNGLAFTWANGRELATVDNNGVTGSYTYNDSGIRTSKTYNGVTTNYYLNGSSVVRQTDGTKTLDFLYDENGNLYGFKEAGSMYYYVRNGQNDIIGILDNTGAQVVSYVYDSWGNSISTTGTSATTIGADNPFRYRGYYFDSDIGLYYLNSRYYDSKVERFINADDTKVITLLSQDLLQINLFSYSINNPVNVSDPTGYSGRLFYISLKDILKLLVFMSINPIGAVLISLGVRKLAMIIYVQLVAFGAKLGSFFGPQGAFIVGFIIAVLGIPSVADLAGCIFDVIMQGKSGIEVSFKIGFWGGPYGLDFEAK